jgi:hypothetical protein
MTQSGSEDSLFRRLFAKRRLGAGRLHPTMRRYDAQVAIPRECRQLLSCRMTQQPLEGPFRQLGQLSDGMYANLN